MTTYETLAREHTVTEPTQLQTLVSALNENCTTLASRMRLGSDAIVINQCNEDAQSEYIYGKHIIRCFHMNGRGVGASRNAALAQADASYCLFSDNDIVYRDGYAGDVEKAFIQNPRADMLLFNVNQAPERKTYHIDDFGRVRWYNYGRYPAYAIAARTAKLKEAGVQFSLLFGGGAPFMNGEDSMFLHDCLEKGLKIFHVPVLIGEETPGESTWFHGYNEKFFFDRGVLYHHLYGRMAYAFGMRFLVRGRSRMCREMSFKRCAALMEEGIRYAAVSDLSGGHPYAGVSDEQSTKTA